jgi:hypothetical protein
MRDNLDMIVPARRVDMIERKAREVMIPGKETAIT